VREGRFVLAVPVPCFTEQVKLHNFSYGQKMAQNQFRAMKRSSSIHLWLTSIHSYKLYLEKYGIAAYLTRKISDAKFLSDC
jgi:hypothetical protein